MGFGVRSKVIGVGVLIFMAGCISPAMPEPDHDDSAFLSALLLDNNRVVFTFKHVTWRPGPGHGLGLLSSDGGIPEYTNDETMIGVFDLGTNALHLLAREKNSAWTNDQGHFIVSQANGPMVLVRRGGETRDLKGMLSENFLLNVDDGTRQPLNFRQVLTEKGQPTQFPYLVSPQGHMVFVTSPEEWPRPDSETGQIWLRAPDDSYHLVSDTKNYERTENGEIVYWLPATREFKAFNMTTYETRSRPRYKRRLYVDVTDGAIVDSISGKVELQHKVNGTWNNTALPIGTEQVIKAKVSK